jgi:hypothetical protein
MKRSGKDIRSGSSFTTHCVLPIHKSPDRFRNIQRYAKDTLPVVCEKKHGQPVVRSRIGALSGKPLCEQEPEMPDTCTFKHEQALLTASLQPGIRTRM